MELDDYAIATLIQYRKAHLAWKAAPEGPEKVAAKRERGQMHSRVLELAELCERRSKER